jgi:Domain of unknown function (DUF4386)
VLEFGLIVTQIGTAVVIYWLVRRQSESISLGYVSARIMESVFAAIGIMSIISIVNVADSLSATGADASALAVTGNSLASTYQWAFQWGPGLVAGIGNGLMLGYLMYRSELVPRRMAMIGLIGGPLLILSHVLILCGAFKNGRRHRRRSLRHRRTRRRSRQGRRLDDQSGHRRTRDPPARPAPPRAAHRPSAR